jgi:hypothetical protein
MAVARLAERAEMIFRRKGIVVAFVLVWCLITTMVVRDMVVFRYRGRVLDAISRCADGDIKARREWRWRFDAFRRVSYDDMMIGSVEASVVVLSGQGVHALRRGFRIPIPTPATGDAAR